MKSRLFKAGVCLWAIAVFVTADRILVASSATEKETGLIRRVSWTNAKSGAFVRGLLGFQTARLGMATWLYVEEPAGRRVVLGLLIDPRTGVLRDMLLDDQTGGWFETSVRTGIEADDSQAFLKRGTEELTGDRGKPLPIVIRSQGGVTFQAMVPTRPDGGSDCRSLAATMDAAKRKLLAQEVPHELDHAIAFLDESAGTSNIVPRDGSEFRCIIEFLAGVLRESGRGRRSTEEWRQRSEPVWGGVELKDAEDIRFLSEFKTVKDATRPLLGPRVGSELKRESSKVKR